MNRIAVEWLRKVDVDLDGIRRALLPLPLPNLELGAYHCQQATEKLLRHCWSRLAWLIRAADRPDTISGWRSGEFRPETHCMRTPRR